MVSTIIPLIKDKLGDITSSNNYRSIALSSLLLKIYDWIMLILFEKQLHTDELQFGFQEETSTNMCTWLAIETIDHFMRNGSEVFVGVIDMTKAFDKVRQSDLFWKLIQRGIPLIYLRLLLDMYLKQTAGVLWTASNAQFKLAVQNSLMDLDMWMGISTMRRSYKPVPASIKDVHGAHAPICNRTKEAAILL